MDCDTFERHRDLAVPEPSPTTAALPLLTMAEKAAYKAVTASGLRLEQERLPWSLALEVLRL